jgi:hypothetical protein
MYTRAMHQEYTKHYSNITTFTIKSNPDLDVRCDYLVRHEIHNNRNYPNYYRNLMML